METPLDVLSRAASMVQTRDSNASNEDVVLKRSMDERESPPKELPTKYYKYKRMKERQEVPSRPNLSKEHPGRCTDHSRKCAGTQTAFSSFNAADGHDHCVSAADSYHQQVSPAGDSSPTEEQYTVLDLDKGHRKTTVPSVPHLPRGEQHSPTAHHLQSPHPLHQQQHQHAAMQVMGQQSNSNNLPLNLTVCVTSSAHNTHNAHTTHTLHQLRPSVITCATSTVGMDSKLTTTSPPGSVTSNGHVVNRPTDLASRNGQAMHRPGSRQVTSVDMCDPVIEEHFRRSLGKNYPECIMASPSSSPATTPTSPPPTATVNPFNNHSEPPRDNGKETTGENNVSVTGTVDDHFAKSLGDTWTQIQASTNPMSGSVDDHFAKALGDTWYRIKAQKESN